MMSIQRWRVVRALRSALARGEFVINYQPQADITDGTPRVTGYEALSRWQHPRLGFLPPDKFLPLMEEESIVDKLDIMVLEDCCRETRARLDAGKQAYHAAINVSRKTVQKPEALREFQSIRERYAVPENVITLEFSERAALEEPLRLRDSVLVLQAGGFQCALDNFTDDKRMHSLLQSVQMDAVKLSPTLFQDADKRDVTRLLELMTFARQTHMRVIAEGVETAEQLAFLRSIGCVCAQGRALSAPVERKALKNAIQSAEAVVVPVFTPRVTGDAQTELTERQLLAVIRSVPGGAFSRGEEDERPFAYISRGLAELLGFESTEALRERFHNSWLEMVSESSLREAIRQTREPRDGQEIYYMAKCADSTEKPLMEKSTRLMEPDGRSMCYCVVIDAAQSADARAKEA